MNARRSGCPIDLTLEALGDRWSLIVIRDLMFGREPNQENGEEEHLTVQIAPFSLVGAWLVRFFDARELR